MPKLLKTVPKISVKIWRPIIEKFDLKIEHACLRRDAYLTRVLDLEVDRLDQDVCLPNSDASYEYVFQQLDRLDRKLVSLALPPELTSRINDVCRRKRIVRDAFFNRLFLLLAASPRIIDRLLFDSVGSGWRTDVWSEDKHDAPFFQNVFYPLEPLIDPFWAIRAGLNRYAQETKLEEYIEPESGSPVHVMRDVAGKPVPPDNIYTTVFDLQVQENDLIGLSCYLTDSSIPGHAAQTKQQAMLDQLLAELRAMP